MNRRQTIPAHLRYTRNQFDKEFPNDDVCLEQIKEQRWPKGIAHCATCGKDRKHYRVTGRTAYACDRCGHHIYPLAGTIFQKSTTPLRTWFQAMYLMGSTRCGISAKQIQRETGVTYKTAWRMFKQIRMLLAEDVQLEGSPVEMDEMFVGGRRRRRTEFDPSNKTCVVGMVERKGRVRALIADDNTQAQVWAFKTDDVKREPANNQLRIGLIYDTANPMQRWSDESKRIMTSRADIVYSDKEIEKLRPQLHEQVGRKGRRR